MDAEGIDAEIEAVIQFIKNDVRQEGMNVDKDRLLMAIRSMIKMLIEDGEQTLDEMNYRLNIKDEIINPAIFLLVSYKFVHQVEKDRQIIYEVDAEEVKSVHKRMHYWLPQLD